MRAHILVLLCGLQWALAQWTKPNAEQSCFADTYSSGERIRLSWLRLNESTNDELWIARYDPKVDDFALRLWSALDISKPGSFDWTISIEDDIIQLDTRFIAFFLPPDAIYDSSARPNTTSPPFNLILVNQPAAPNGTISVCPSALLATATSANSDSSATPAVTPTTSPVPSGSNTGDSTPADSGFGWKAGAGIGAAGAAVVGLCALGFALLIRHRRKSRRMKTEISDKIDGPYEILGDRRMPTELSSRDTSRHELSGSKETTLSEADSSSIHELGGIVKKPGLHELPG